MKDSKVIFYKKKCRLYFDLVPNKIPSTIFDIVNHLNKKQLNRSV